MSHTPVLLDEVIKGLDVKSDDRILDCTVGNGGHASFLIRRLGPKGYYIGIDADSDALKEAEKQLEGNEVTYELYEGNYRNFERVLDDLGIGTVDKILIDMGVRMDQFESSGRGFSFKRDEPLVMTFKRDPEEGDLTAFEIVNEWEEASIRDIISGYGEERYARRIAEGIVKERALQPIESTFDLIEVIRTSVPAGYTRGRTHFATKTFQALRTTVNDEIESLREGLHRGFQRLENGGRFAVISFHSIEDRIVKRFFREKSNHKEGRIISKKPITPREEEIRSNPASRSAKLRIIEKI